MGKCDSVSLLTASVCMIALTISIFSLTFQERVLAQSELAEISVTRIFPESGLLPEAHQYVRFDIAIKNMGAGSISNQTLWALFASSGGKTNTLVTHALPDINPSETKTIHLGPFKMHEGGQHALYMGINSQSNSSLPIEVDIGKGPGDSFDSFMVYDPQLFQLIYIAVLTISSGLSAAVMIGRLRRKSRDRKAV